jgi:hypothetical protein
MCWRKYCGSYTAVSNGEEYFVILLEKNSIPQQKQFKIKQGNSIIPF